MHLDFSQIKIKKRLILNSGSLIYNFNSITVVKGTNGIGKTLLLKKIFYEYEDESAIFIEQNNNFILTDKTVLDNIIFNNTNKKDLIKFLKENNLFYLLDKKTKTLSGGEKRLIVLLRGLFSKEKIIFIDEPTNDLDYNFTKIIISLLNKIKKQKSLIIISHDDRIIDCADILYTIENNDLLLIKGKDLTYNEEKIESSYLPIYKKIVTFNYFSVILIIIALTLLISLLFMFNKNNNITTKKFFNNTNQVDLISIGALKYINDDKSDYLLSKDITTAFFTNNPFKISKIIAKQKRHYNVLKPTNINIVSNKNYIIYPIVIKDKANNTFYSLIDIYLTELGFDPSFTNLDTSEYFDYKKINYIEIKNTILFNKVKYNQFINNFFSKNKNKYIITYSILIFNNNYNFNDLILSAEFSKLDSNVVLYSNEIRNIMENNLIFNKNIKLISIALSSLFSFLIFNAIVTFLLLFIYKKNIIIYKNQNVNLDNITLNVKEYSNPKISYYFFILFFLIINIVINKGKVFILFDYLLSYMVFTLVCLSYNFNNKIINYYLTKITSWRYRTL